MPVVSGPFSGSLQNIMSLTRAPQARRTVVQSPQTTHREKKKLPEAPSMQEKLNWQKTDPTGFSYHPRRNSKQTSDSILSKMMFLRQEYLFSIPLVLALTVDSGLYQTTAVYSAASSLSKWEELRNNLQSVRSKS